MKCPHCNVEIHPAFRQDWLWQGQGFSVEDGQATSWQTESMRCPACARAIIYLINVRQDIRTLVYPKSAGRPKADPAVPADLAENFNEACLVLSDT